MNHRISVLVLALTSAFFPASLQAQLSIYNDMTHLDNAAPGQTYQGSIVVQNAGKETERVQLYLTDYLFYADGSNLFGEPGKDPRSNASWISFRESEFIIAPGKDHEVPYTVHVPQDRALVGSYWSVAMVQSITQSLLNPDKKADDKLGITAGIRIGIQMVTNIGETGIRKLRFSDTKLQKGEDFSTLQISLENSGERRLRPLPYADLYDSQGALVGHFPLREITLYPGTATRLQFPLAGLAKGRYKAQIVADCGGNDIFGGIYSLELK